MLKHLLKRAFELWCERLWLKEIDKEQKKCKKYKQKATEYEDKARKSMYVANKLFERYKELYPNETLRGD